jgi:hypothetical protein
MSLQGGQYELDSIWSHLWTNNNFTFSILGGYQVKKMWALITVIATAILSGALLSRFLNWAGEKEIFDFDLNEDIDDDLSAI